MGSAQANPPVLTEAEVWLLTPRCCCLLLAACFLLQGRPNLAVAVNRLKVSM